MERREAFDRHGNPIPGVSQSPHVLSHSVHHRCTDIVRWIGLAVMVELALIGLWTVRVLDWITGRRSA